MIINHAAHPHIITLFSVGLVINNRSTGESSSSIIDKDAFNNIAETQSRYCCAKTVNVDADNDFHTGQFQNIMH